ncbi:MAG: efflux transporter outer membrane subunit [Bacteroidales bacterium]|nr:efflux transporter outer membrane subunit [Bacteroidales bacterium]
MKIYRYIILIAGLLSFSSCGLYKKYERPATDFADSLYNRLPQQDDTTSIAEISWEDFFNDPILKEWINVGLENNTDLNVARLKVDEAEAVLTAARGAFLPGVNAALKEQVSAPGGNAFSVNIGASWEADIFGKLRNSKHQAAAALEQSVAYRQAVQTQLVASIANMYYTLLMLDEQMSVSQRTYDNWKENIRTMEALKRAGKTNEAAVLQAKSNQLNVQASMIDLEQSIVETENAFCALLGIVPVTVRRGHLNEQNFPIELSAGLPSGLLSRRPDVKQAEMALAQAYYATNVAQASFYPQLSLSGTLGWNASGASVDPSEFFANLAASVLQPVFAKRSLKANLKKAKAQQEEALYQFRQAVLDAGVEVNNALIQWQAAQERMEVDRSQVVHLKAAVWNTQLLMKHGGATYIEVLTAQQTLLKAELAEASDKFAQIQGVINLYHALGGGY